ncbi:MAG: HNH endonuclease [Blastocatellales bacterium]
MSHIPAFLRRLVIRRAEERCEYCQLSQAGQEATFHIDHIIPVVDGGQTSAENLALACVSCSLRKGARNLASDPHTGEEAELFHPRFDAWDEHFRWDGEQVVGISAKGRATIALLDLNRPIIISIRKEESLLGRHPKQAD